MLTGLLDAVSTDKCNYAIEFRHQSWLDESKKELDPEVLKILKVRNVANVIIDGPGLHFDGSPRRATLIFVSIAETMASGIRPRKMRITGSTDTITFIGRRNCPGQRSRVLVF